MQYKITSENNSSTHLVFLKEFQHGTSLILPLSWTAV